MAEDFNNITDELGKNRGGAKILIDIPLEKRKKSEKKRVFQLEDTLRVKKSNKYTFRGMRGYKSKLDKNLLGYRDRRKH